MTFKEFAINYLNPIFLMYRAFLLIVAFYIFVFTIPMFTHSASGSELLIVVIASFAISIGLYITFRTKAYVLYLLIPSVFVIVSFIMRGEDVVKEGVMMLPMTMCFSAAFLLAFNGFRPWGTGISMNDINNKLRKNE
jgi:hypothetical protein